MSRALSILPAIAIVIGALSVPALTLAAHAAPLPGNPVTVIAAPWLDARTVVASAGGTVLLPGRTAFVAQAFADDPVFAQTLVEHGAWVVLDGGVADFLCL